MHQERYRPQVSARRRRTCTLFITAAVVLQAHFARGAAPVISAAAQETPAAALTLPSPAGDISYTARRGLRLGDTRLTLAGYSNLNLVRDEGGPARLTLDDVSLFVIWDPISRFHFFSELEIEDLVEVDDHGRGGSNQNRFIAERLYGDVALADALNVRAGKFLTPVGRWNVIHAQPLVWTTSRPLATELPFDLHTTGALLFGTLFPESGSVTYGLYGQFADQLDRTPDDGQVVDRSVGGRLQYDTARGLSVGASYLSATRAGRWEHLVGLDTLWQQGPFELMGEAVFEDAPRALGTQGGGYLQGVVEVVRQWYLVGRYEYYAPPLSRPAVNLGLAYKPWPPVIVKAEYLIADHRAEESPPGFKCSFAILF